MIKLALVGKEIQHSLSPQVYRDLIEGEFKYDLLDYSSENEIPSAIKLLKDYRGISITSPYKAHFLKEVDLTETSKKLYAINCLKMSENKIIGENTDFFAIKDIVSNFNKQYGELEIIILGDGVMSKVTQVALSDLGVSFQVLTRKLIKHLDTIDLTMYFSQTNKFSQNIVINTCARSFVFNGAIDNKTIFWDYNYNFLPHIQKFSDQSKNYIDGKEMLILQAKYALSFWSI